MKNALTRPSLALLVLLGARTLYPQRQSVDPTTAAAAATDASADNGWQTLRTDYMTCVQHQVGNGVSGATQTKDVITSALNVCEGTLCTMHDGFRDHLSASMPSSGTRRAADCVTKGAREKAHVYLMGYVDHACYLAKSR